MISIIKYLYEMMAGGRSYNDDGTPTKEYYEALKELKARKLKQQQEQQGTGTTKKIIKKIIKPNPEVTPQPEKMESGTLINPIKKIIKKTVEATQQ